MRLGLAFDVQTDPADWRQAECDPPRVIDQLCAALTSLGHEVVRLGNAHGLLANPSSVQGIDLVFNIAEGKQGRCREAEVPTLLDLWRVPYVGSDALALSIGLDKHLSKQLAIVSGIPTPPWVVVNHPDEVPAHLPFEWPVIVKPRYEGSGIGIDEGAVVREMAALRTRVAWAWERFRQPLLIEQFIPHGELTVLLIGNDPPVAYAPIQRSLDPASRLSCHVARSSPRRVENPLELTDQLDREARRIALTMCAALGCADMARVDVRVDAQGRAWFLEINPLPSFDPEGTVGLLAEHANITYAQLLERIVEAACARLRLPTAVTR